ncbi:SRPBCC family protein [Paenibacillus kobensis]|uniref:SRPBCC family protein n=1 Tax=Paenibacillus kobensis TaxID=59841 RepID=UPI000FDB355F|nr:SRPBCC family protein [Paenibacillus kobensis]
MTTVVGTNEIITTRELEFAREDVFKAWTTPELIARWWGPDGFTNTIHEFDPRPGGDWRFIMHGPDGTDYSNHNVFVEVVPYERIVIKHLFAPEFQVTATFEERGGATGMMFHQTFNKPEEFEAVKGYCGDANEQNLDRLHAVLAGLAK